MTHPNLGVRPGSSNRPKHRPFARRHRWDR